MIFKFFIFKQNFYIERNKKFSSNRYPNSIQFTNTERSNHKSKDVDDTSLPINYLDSPDMDHEKPISTFLGNEEWSVRQKRGTCTDRCRRQGCRGGFCRKLPEEWQHYNGDSRCCSAGYKWECACGYRRAKRWIDPEDLIRHGLSATCWGYCKYRGYDSGGCVSAPGYTDSWCVDHQACHCWDD